jgi:hypothetical protein
MSAQSINSKMEERLDAIKALCHAALKQKQCIQKQREKFKEALSELKELKAEYEMLQNENETFEEDKRRSQLHQCYICYKSIVIEPNTQIQT